MSEGQGNPLPIGSVTCEQRSTPVPPVPLLAPPVPLLEPPLPLLEPPLALEPPPLPLAPARPARPPRAELPAVFEAPPVPAPDFESPLQPLA
jgi:hypothetical protein